MRLVLVSSISAMAPDYAIRAAGRWLLNSIQATLHFATTFLAAHRNTRHTSIGLDANDAFILETTYAGDPQCIADGLPQVLATLAGRRV